MKCMDVIVYLAGAESGRVYQITGFPSTYYPECNGHESNISECSRVDHVGDCDWQVYVRCYSDPDPQVCGIATPSTGSPLTMTEQSTATSSESQFHTTTTATVDSTGATKPTSEPVVTNSGQGSNEQRQSDQTLIITIAVSVGAVFVASLLVSALLCLVLIVMCYKRSPRDKNFNDQVSPDSPIKVRKSHEADSKNIEPVMYSELNNTVVQHQVPIYDTVKNKVNVTKSQNLSEVSASDSNDDTHMYSELDPEALYTQIAPHLGPGNSSTLPPGLPASLPAHYQKLDRSLSLPRTTGAANSAAYVPHAVNRTALALESGSVDEAEIDSQSESSGSSIKYPSPHGSPRQNHSSKNKEEVVLVRDPANSGQAENIYHILDPSTSCSADHDRDRCDLDSQVSTDAVCNQRILDDNEDRRPRCYTTVGAMNSDHHFYATLEPSPQDQVTPPFRHDARQRSQSATGNRSPLQPHSQQPKVHVLSNSLKHNARVNGMNYSGHSGHQMPNNDRFSQSSFKSNRANVNEEQFLDTMV